MAIVEMKKISLLAMNQDKQRLMSGIQRLGCVQLVERDQGERIAFSNREKARLQELAKAVGRLDLSISRLAPFDKHKQGMLSPRPSANADQVASVLASRGEAMAVVDRMEAIERTRGELRAQEARARAQIDQLTPWEHLDVPLDRLGPTKTSELMLVTIAQKNLPQFSEGAGRMACEIEQVSQLADICNLLCAVHSEHSEAFQELMKACDASRVSFQGAGGLASLQIDQLHAKIARVAEVREQLNEEVDKHAEQLPILRILRDTMALERDQMQAASLSENTKSAFLLSGWVPGNQCEHIERELKRVAPLTEIGFEDAPEGEKPPTMLRNNSAVSPFETIVKMFSTPDPHGVDPTFLMMPFWICFFGMMVSDAGYGIVLGLVCGYAFHKLGRRSTIGKMAFILMLGGLSTVFWGAMYGGWFSIDVPWIKPILFAPMDEPLMMVILCLAIGVVHIFAGMGLAAYMNFKRGKPLDALYDQFSWMMILIGLGLMAVNGTVGGIVAITGTLIVLVMAGREKKNPLKRLMSGLGALYGISGFVSDILSYARLFGMGLATGVIGMVFNTLAIMLWEGGIVGMVFAVVLLVFGHTFNLLINSLGAYVHSCRLQFIEFFSKFYESGGADFMPLQPNTRYVDIEQGDIAA